MSASYLSVKDAPFDISRITELDIEESLELPYHFCEWCGRSVGECDGRVQIKSHENFRETYCL